MNPKSKKKTSPEKCEKQNNCGKGFMKCGLNVGATGMVAR
jgi:hypothetical protein